MLDAESPEQSLDQVAARPVGLDEAEHVVAGPQEREQAGGNRGDAGTERDAVVALLELCQQLFELARGRIRRPRVDVALALAAARAKRLLEALEGELDGLVDRRDERTIVRRQHDLRRMIDARAAFHCDRRRGRAPIRPA